MTEFHVGDTIAGYTISGVCGKGAYGVVYRVIDSLGTELALKILPSGKISEREINALLNFRACRHPNLLTILHVSKLPDGRFFYTMDLADSASDSAESYQPDTLALRLSKKSFAPEEVGRILRELLAGLDELHKAHLLHRDIKPANILFIRGRAVLADIGLVTTDASASLIGTPDYLPEDLLKSHRAMTASDDCYALGLILYCMLTGEPPHQFPSIPKTLRAPSMLHLLKIAEKACTSPGFSNAEEFLKQLDQPFLPVRKCFTWKWIVGGAAILVILAVIAVLLWNMPETSLNTVHIQKSTSIPHKTSTMPDSASVVYSPRSYQWGSSINAQKLEETLPAAPAPIIYVPEIAASLKKYQLTEAEEVKRKRRMLPYLHLNTEKAKKVRQQLVAVYGTTPDADEEFRLEMNIKELLETIGSDTPTPSELKRLEKALQRLKKTYSSKKP